MSEILIGTNPNNPEIVGVYSSTAAKEEKARQLPIPSGYRILCAIPEVEEKFPYAPGTYSKPTPRT